MPQLHKTLWWRWLISSGGGLVLMAIAIYISSVRNQLFWDDFDFITNNITIHSLRNWPLFFTQSVIAGSGLVSNYFRPVLMILFSIQWQFFQANGGGYHLVSLALHIINAWLIFWLLKKMWRSELVAFGTALLFVVHPLQVETVAYANSQGDALSVFCILLGLTWWQLQTAGAVTLSRVRRLTALATLAVGYGLALLSKESAIIFPGLVAMWITWSPEQRQQWRGRRWWSDLVWWVVPLVVMGLVYVALRATVWNFQNSLNLYNAQNIFTQNFYVRLYTFWGAQVNYWRLFLVPFPLFMERSIAWLTSMQSPVVWLGMAGTVGAAISALLAWRKWPWWSFAVTWYFICFFPFSNLAVPINGILYEHFLYLPQVGVGFLISWLLVAAARRWDFLQSVLAVAASVVVIVLAVIAGLRVTDWHDPITFYLKNLRHTPNSYRIINNLGMAYADRKDWEAARVMYERATNLDPQNAVGWHNLGNLEMNTGATTAAEGHFRQALQIQPSFHYSRRALAQLYLDGQNWAAAQTELAILAQEDPQDVSLWTILMRVAAARRDWTTATAAVTHLQKIQPNNIQWWNLAQELVTAQKATPAASLQP